MGSPRWGKEAQEECDAIVEMFRSNLRRIVVAFAKHEQADTIDRRHVTNAFEALIASGLNRSPWWKRPQLKITFGSVLFALAFAIPDFSPKLAQGSETIEDIILWVGVIIFTLLGLGLNVWGWRQNGI